MSLSPASSSGGSSSGGGVVGWGSRSTDLSTAGTTYATGADVLAAPISFTANGTASYAVFINGPGHANNFAGGGKANELALTLDGAQSTYVEFNAGAATSQSLTLAGMGLIATPAAGVHTVNVRFFVAGGTGTLYGSASLPPANILVYVLQLS